MMLPLAVVVFKESCPLLVALLFVYVVDLMKKLLFCTYSVTSQLWWSVLAVLVQVRLEPVNQLGVALGEPSTCCRYLPLEYVEPSAAVTNS